MYKSESSNYTEVNEAARHLVKIQVFYDGKSAYSFNYEGKVHVFRGTVEQLAKFLQSFKAKDNKTQPRSVRGERYADIAKEITDQTDNIIYAWSNDLANALQKKESVEKLTESDELCLSSRSFKSMGLYDKTAKTYGTGWANWLSVLADDKEAQRAGFFLMVYDDLRSMWISDVKHFGQDTIFFCDKTGEREGDFIKFGFFNGAFSNVFARSHQPTFIGVENGQLVIKSNDMYMHTSESLDSILKPLEEGAFELVFIFHDSEVQELFKYWADHYKINNQVLINKIYVYGDVSKSPEIMDLLSKHPDEVENYSIREYQGLQKKGLVESVLFTKEGPEVSNNDSKFLNDLFNMLDGDPRWKVDHKSGRCSRNDGCELRVKGGVIEINRGHQVLAVIPWVRNSAFMILPTGQISIRFEVGNNTELGRIVL